MELLEMEEFGIEWEVWVDYDIDEEELDILEVSPKGSEQNVAEMLKDDIINTLHEEACRKIGFEQKHRYAL